MTMTDAELAEIRARAEQALRYPPIPDKAATQFHLLYRDIPALLDELAAARKENERFREALAQIVASESKLLVNAGEYSLLLESQRMLSLAKNALHSATEDADDRTT